MRSEKVLIVSQNKGLVNQARTLLREAGISIVTVIDTPARALSALWGDTPDITLLDLGGHRLAMMDILPVILGSGRALAMLGTVGISGYRVSEGTQWNEERDMLAGMGVSHCLPADPPPVMLQDVLHRILDGQSAGPATGAAAKKTRMLLFLNDRNRSHDFHQAMHGKPVVVDDAIEVDVLCRSFLDNTPDLVLIDPRGLGHNLVTIGNVARRFPGVRIYFIVPADVTAKWAARAEEFVTRVIEYPEDVAGYGAILALGEEGAGSATAAPDAPVSAADPPAPPVPKKVMVVDDDVAVRTMMVEFLKHFGYTTMEAEDGRAALEMMRRERPDLLISDIYMPRMNGFQLFMEVRNNWPSLPVVLITGYNSAAKEMAAYSIKDADFLEKPFELATVEALVRSKLNRATL